ncbi:MAG: Flp pilus assembly complex ATPase component TadA [Lentisphaeria bacterium]|nr:Flp pilus assembly complex ATPase component TadA [Lentisphaeria bacterium]
MRCEHCGHDFVIQDEHFVGKNVKCPECGEQNLCSTRRVMLLCSECKRELECEVWMLGSRTECPFCGKTISLVRPGSPDDRFPNAYLPPGYELGSCKIVSCLAMGGMGEVYLAHHELLDTDVALRLLFPDRNGSVSDPSFEHLLREARLACRLKSPHIVSVIDVQIEQRLNFGYIVMEYVRGKDLESMLSGPPMSEDSVLNAARQVALALVEAAKLNFVHRDIKPGNIIIADDGRVKLADLGIAKFSGDTVPIPGTRITGTIHYAAPEQLLNPESIDARADIYSLGAAMYNLLSNRRPFDGSSVMSIVAKVLKGEFPPLAEAAPEVSPATCRLVTAMMATDPAKRPQSAADLVREIDRVLRERSGRTGIRRYLPSPAAISDFFRDASPTRRMKVAGIAVAILLLVGAIWGAVSFTSSDSHVETRPDLLKRLPDRPRKQVLEATAQAPSAPAAQRPDAPEAAPAPRKPEAPEAAPVPQKPEAPEAAPAPQKPAASAPAPTAPQPPARTAPRRPSRPQQAAVIPDSPVNYIRLLVMVAWFLSGIKVMQQLAQKRNRKSRYVETHYTVLNFAALVAGPLVWVIVELQEKLYNKVKKVQGKVMNLPEIVNSQGEPAFRDVEDSDEGDVVFKVRSLLAQALTLHASDIFIDPKAGNASVIRFRVDGALRIIEEIDADQGSKIINVIKVVSGMNISERRRPQDGSFSLTGPFGDISLRTATVGSLGGEKVALRILGDDSGPKTLAAAGIAGRDLAVMENAVKLPSGMILICGPTGSGKTTTLYAMLNSIDYSIKNVISIEDPIEHIMPSISQMEVNESAGITFSQLLRNALRQNPDVICVGEIRDEDTAAVAVHAAQTGHLIIATLHSNDNISTIDRLANLNVPLRSIAGTLQVVISQRLVRKLCTCKKRVEPTPEQQATLREAGQECTCVYEPVGCPKCGNTGYSGRMAVFDILTVNDELRALLEDEHTNLSNVRRQLEKASHGNVMARGGYALVARGITSIAEVVRVTLDLKNQ